MHFSFGGSNLQLSTREERETCTAVTTLVTDRSRVVT